MIVEVYVIARAVLHGRGNAYVNLTLKHVHITVVAVEEQ
jgi:hypothetical protein